MSERRARIPLFPLPNVVLFPEARVPLHIFEPRYRQMMEAALAGDRSLGMATVLPSHADTMAADPPLFPVGCAGFITRWNRLADGRYDLVLHGTRRFRIVRELPPEGDRLYRVAEIEWISESPLAGTEDELATRRRDVMALLERLARRSENEEAEVSLDRLSQLDDVHFTNAICAAIGLPPLEKQGLLEAGGAVERAGRLGELLRFQLAQGGGGASQDTRTLH